MMHGETDSRFSGVQGSGPLEYCHVGSGVAAEDDEEGPGKDGEYERHYEDHDENSAAPVPVVSVTLHGSVLRAESSLLVVPENVALIQFRPFLPVGRIPDTRLGVEWWMHRHQADIVDDVREIPPCGPTGNPGGNTLLVDDVSTEIPEKVTI